jgi:hypothetical protein
MGRSACACVIWEGTGSVYTYIYCWNCTVQSVVWTVKWSCVQSVVWTVKWSCVHSVVWTVKWSCLFVAADIWFSREREREREIVCVCVAQQLACTRLPMQAAATVNLTGCPHSPLYYGCALRWVAVGVDWAVTLCRWVKSYRRWESTTVFRNVGDYVPTT